MRSTSASVSSSVRVLFLTRYCKFRKKLWNPPWPTTGSAELLERLGAEFDRDCHYPSPAPLCWGWTHDGPCQALARQGHCGWSRKFPSSLATILPKTPAAHSNLPCGRGPEVLHQLPSKQVVFRAEDDVHCLGPVFGVGPQRVHGLYRLALHKERPIQLLSGVPEDLFRIDLPLV